MSTCPDSDLFSVYLDGELPAQYCEKLEAHLSSCQDCRRKFDTLKGIHMTLKADAGDILISDKALEDSYTKLLAKKSYNNYKKNSSRRGDIFLKRVLPAMAAALVIAVVLPIRLLNSGTVYLTTDSKVAKPGIQDQLRRTGIATDSGINVMSIASQPENGSSSAQKAAYAADLSSALQNQILTSIDIFGSEINTKKIQITIDLSNVSGISTSDKDSMKLIPMTVSLPSEGQQ